MSLGRRFVSTGAAAATCNTDSVQAFGADNTYSSNIALYQLDSDGGTTNNVPDTTTNYNGTASNITYASGYINNAAVFNGSSSKIEVSNQVIPNGATSISFWYNPEGSTSTEYIIGQGAATASKGVTVYWTSQSFGALVAKGTSSLAGSATGSTTYSTTDWHNVVCTWDGTTSSNALKVYVNGSLLVQGTSDTSSASIGTYTNFAIGGLLGGTFASGSIDQVRIFNKAISAEDVATLYNETSSTASNTNPLGEGAGVALYSLDYDASEASGYYDGAPSNVTFGVGGKTNFGARFNGSSSSKIVTTADFDGSTLSGSSISFWFNTTQTSVGALFGSDTIQGGAGQGSTIYLGSASSSIADESISFWDFNGSTTSVFYAKGGSTYYQDGNWHHCTIISTSSSKQIWIDGQSQTVYYFSSGSASANAKLTDIIIGDDDTGGGFNFDGTLDQVRIFSKALNSTEISQLWNNGNGEIACVYDCTTDTVNYPSGTTPVAYIPFDNSAEDLVSGDLGTLGSGTEFSFGRFGQAMVGNQNTWSADFPNISETANSPFSVSCWVNIADRNSTIYFFLWSSGFGSSSAWGGLLSGQSGKYYTNFGNQVLVSSSSVVPPLNQWFHYVLTYDGTNVKVYSDTEVVIDGNINTSALASNNLKVLYNGSSSEAKIDQMRIYSTALTSSQVTELYEEKPCADTSNFKAVLYEGNGGTQYISNVGMDLETNGGLVWLKGRDSARDHRLFDSVRGATKGLYSNLANAEFTESGLDSFEDNGFFLGSAAGVNANNESFVAWTWLAGGEAAQNNDGTINGADCMVSANTEAGFSIIKYVGNATSGATIGHGLGAKPDLVLFKNLDHGGNYHWTVYSNTTATGATGLLYLNLTDAFTTTSSRFNDTEPTTSVITLGNDGTINDSGDDHIAYCWHSVAGYSKIGSYTGNGNVSGPTITTNFEPSWVMVKRTDNAGAWNIQDNKRNTTNPRNTILQANDSAGDITNTAYNINFDSTSFQIVNTGSNWNTLNGTYLYMAFK